MTAGGVSREDPHRGGPGGREGVLGVPVGPPLASLASAWPASCIGSLKGEAGTRGCRDQLYLDAFKETGRQGNLHTRIDGNAEGNQ